LVIRLQQIPASVGACIAIPSIATVMSGGHIHCCAGGLP